MMAPDLLSEPTDSLFRRRAKRAIARLLPAKAYQRIQALVMAWDINTGSWREPEIDLLASAVQPGETVLDVGANFGLYSYHLSRAVGPSGSVLCFEPVPWTFEILTTVVKLLRLRNVQLIPKGCSDRSGKITFRAPLQANNVISAGLAYIADRDAGAKRLFGGASPSYREFCCDVVALDEFLLDSKPIAFIKCDVEGAEGMVFKGATNIIKRDMPAILCEVEKDRLEAFDINAQEFLEFFIAHGYGIYYYGADGKDKGHLIETDALRDSCSNYLFLPLSRKRQFASWFL